MFRWCYSCLFSDFGLDVLSWSDLGEGLGFFHSLLCSVGNLFLTPFLSFREAIFVVRLTIL